MTHRERMERRLERRLTWAESRDRKAEAASQTAAAIADGIPFGQPILVGHHSEAHHRRDVARIQSNMSAAVESYHMAEHHREKAEGIERQLDRSIYSDDPDATERLREKIAGLEAERSRMKQINAEIKRGPGWEDRLSVAGLTLTEREHQQLIDVARFQGYNCFPPYALQNLGGNINRLKKRLAEMGGGEA